MTCYKQSNLCYGTEWPIMAHGQVAMACSGHRTGMYKRPVVKVDVIDHDIVGGHKDLKRHLVPFIQEEIGHAPMDIYGTDGLGDIAAQVYAFSHDHATVVQEPIEPTHVFILWDMVHDDQTFKRVDAMLDQGVVVHTLTL